MTASLTGKVALVAGAGRGIGAAIARELSAGGAAVWVADLSMRLAEDTATALVAEGGAAFPLGLDVTSAESWSRAVAHVAAAQGRLDIFVHNVGLTIVKTVEETDLEDWRRIMQVNLEAPFIGVKAVLPLMKQSAKASPHGGSMVFISSVSGIVGTANLAAYTASKAGLRYFSKSIALDFARKGYRIRANSVHPGLTEGPATELLIDYRLEQGLSQNRDEARNAWVSNYPLGRMARPEEIAAGVVYLASDESSFVTGSELVIDGGLSA